MIRYTDSEIFELIKSKYFEKRIKILSPVIKSRKGHYRDLFASVKKQGFDKVRVDGVIIDIENGMELDRYKICHLYTSPSPRDRTRSRMPSSA